MGNDPRYNNSRCFETFPFPDEDTGLTPALRDKIGQLAEQIDAHRKKVLAPESGNTGLTLTGLYNVLAALREGRALSAKEKTIHPPGLVGVLRELKKALQFDSSDVSGVIEDLDLLLQDFLGRIEKVKGDFLDVEDEGSADEKLEKLVLTS